MTGKKRIIVLLVALAFLSDGAFAGYMAGFMTGKAAGVDNAASEQAGAAGMENSHGSKPPCHQSGTHNSGSGSHAMPCCDEGAGDCPGCSLPPAMALFPEFIQAQSHTKDHSYPYQESPEEEHTMALIRPPIIR